jgi:hypothetical protein
MTEDVQLTLMTATGAVESTATPTGTPGLFVTEDNGGWLIVHGRSGYGLVYGLPSIDAARYCALLLAGLGDWTRPQRQIAEHLDFTLLDFIAVECGGWPCGDGEDPELNPRLSPASDTAEPPEETPR